MYSSKENYTINTINAPSNKEESNIYKLVDIISTLQKKISNLSQSMEHNKKNELYQKLSLIEDEILKNKKKINNYISKQKQNEINFKKMKYDNEIIIKKIDDQFDEINQRINNIVSGGKNNDKEIYQISNKNIDKILSQKKNEDELKNLDIDYNSMIIIYQNLLNVLEVNINKRYQLTEKLNMLKEEIIISEEKVIEYISKKESLEEVSKIYLLKFFNEILSNNIKYSDENINEENKIESTNIIRVNSSQNNNIIEPSNGAHSSLLNNKNTYLNNNYNNFNLDNENFKIYLYELKIIDINDLSKEISFQIIIAINSYIKNLYLNNKSLSNSLFHNSGRTEKNLSNIDNTQINSKTIFNTKDKNSFISLLTSKIKKEILVFMNNISSEQNNDADKFEKLIE